MPAEYLEGGQAAWIAAGLPLVDPGKLTARDAEGTLVGLTANSFNSVSLVPPLVLRRLQEKRASRTPDLQGEVPGDV